MTTSFLALLCGPAAGRHPPLGVFSPCCVAPPPSSSSWPLQFPFLSSPRSSHPCLSHSTYSSEVPRARPLGPVLLPHPRLPQSLYLTPCHLVLSPKHHLKEPMTTEQGGYGGLCDIFPLLHTCHLSLFQPFYRTLSHRHSNCGIIHVQSGLSFLMHGSVSLDNCVQACSYHHHQGTEQLNPRCPWAVPL